MIKMKWKAKTKLLHICICGMCFEELKDWVQHKKDTRAWRKYHERLNTYGVFRVYKRK